MKEYIVTVDIAKKRDFFALMVLKDVARVLPANELLDGNERIIHHYDIVYLEQARGIRYDNMADRISRVTSHRDLSQNHDLIVDGTGVGEAAVDLIRRDGLYPVPIVFTGGDTFHEVYEDIGKVFANIPGKLQGARTLKEIRVPKKDLIVAGNVLLQQHRVHVAKGIKHREELEEQLVGFKGKVNENTQRKRYEAETEDLHDDLVVCYLMGAWWAIHRSDVKCIRERELPPGQFEEKVAGSYEPADFF